MRNFSVIVIAGALALVSGCQAPPRNTANPPLLHATPTFSQYHLESFAWGSVARVLVLPLLNESEYTRAGVEVEKALRAELQSLGRFEVVAAPPDVVSLYSAGIHRSGQFNEARMLEMARDTHADVIVHGTVTNYSPYPRPRLGLVLQAVSPTEAKVVASVDGLWDSTRFDVAERIRIYYKIHPHDHPWIVNHDIIEEDSYSGEMALDSPHLFQRFVCAEAVLNLVKDGAVVSARLNESAPVEQGKCTTSPYLRSSEPISTSPRNFPGW